MSSGMPAKSKETTSEPDPLYLAVGRRVAELREGGLGIAPPAFAALVGMDVNYLWRIEAGRQNLSLRNLARLAKALNVTLADLVAGIDVSDIPLESRPYPRRIDET